MRSVECEETNLGKFGKIQLPNYFKKVGGTIAILSLIVMVVDKVTVDTVLIKTVAKYIILTGLLLVSISKDRIEDERIVNLRMQSFMIAFLIAVIYTLVMPLITAGLDVLFSESAIIKPIKDILILWILLSMQIFSFEVLKRTNS